MTILWQSQRCRDVERFELERLDRSEW
jgi:hypothetical protein